MSIKSKFSTFTAAYKAALKNNSNDEWSEAGKGITAKDTFSTIGKGLLFGAVATAKCMSSDDNLKNGYHSSGYGGSGFYSNGVHYDDD